MNGPLAAQFLMLGCEYCDGRFREKELSNKRERMGWEADSEKASLSGMRRACFVILFSLGVITWPSTASELEGPARFYGYSPTIDLGPGEKITTLQGGIHGGSFRWDGDFGSMVVRGIGWASRPNGRLVMQPAEGRPGQFA